MRQSGRLDEDARQMGSGESLDIAREFEFLDNGQEKNEGSY